MNPLSAGSLAREFGGYAAPFVPATIFTLATATLETAAWFVVAKVLFINLILPGSFALYRLIQKVRADREAARSFDVIAAVNSALQSHTEKVESNLLRFDTRLTAKDTLILRQVETIARLRALILLVKPQLIEETQEQIDRYLSEMLDARHDETKIHKDRLSDP
jgi:hypothetical protein